MAMKRTVTMRNKKGRKVTGHWTFKPADKSQKLKEEVVIQGTPGNFKPVDTLVRSKKNQSKILQAAFLKRLEQEFADTDNVEMKELLASARKMTIKRQNAMN